MSDLLIWIYSKKSLMHQGPLEILRDSIRRVSFSISIIVAVPEPRLIGAFGAALIAA